MIVEWWRDDDGYDATDAGSVTEMIKLEANCQSKYHDRMLPVLDLKIYLDLAYKEQLEKYNFLSQGS